MNETKETDQNYWKNENIDNCYYDALGHLKACCNSGKLPNYFNTSENILAGKDKEVLKDLAVCAKSRRDELAHLRQ